MRPASAQACKEWDEAAAAPDYVHERLAFLLSPASWVRDRFFRRLVALNGGISAEQILGSPSLRGRATVDQVLAVAAKHDSVEVEGNMLRIVKPPQPYDFHEFSVEIHGLRPSERREDVRTLLRTLIPEASVRFVSRTQSHCYVELVSKDHVRQLVDQWQIKYSARAGETRTIYACPDRYAESTWRSMRFHDLPAGTDPASFRVQLEAELGPGSVETIRPCEDLQRFEVQFSTRHILEKAKVMYTEKGILVGGSVFRATLAPCSSFLLRSVQLLGIDPLWTSSDVLQWFNHEFPTLSICGVDIDIAYDPDVDRRVNSLACNVEFETPELLEMFMTKDVPGGVLDMDGATIAVCRPWGRIGRKRRPRTRRDDCLLQISGLWPDLKTRVIKDSVVELSHKLELDKVTRLRSDCAIVRLAPTSGMSVAEVLEALDQEGLIIDNKDVSVSKPPASTEDDYWEMIFARAAERRGPRVQVDSAEVAS